MEPTGESERKPPLGDFKEVLTGMTAGLPIVVGYIPIAIAFGILVKTGGIPLWGAAMMSLLVYAGASQFIAIAMIGAGAGAVEIVLTTFLVNLRHFLMSASLTQRLHAMVSHVKPVLAFGVTDEVFSVASLKEGNHHPAWLFGLQAVAYSSWVSGTIVGYLAGQVLPLRVQQSLSIALYAMFLALLVPAVKKSLGKGAVAGLAALIHIVLRLIPGLPASWAMIGAIVLGAALGSVIDREPAEKVEASA